MAQKRDLWYSNLALAMFNMGRLGFRLTLAMGISYMITYFLVSLFQVYRGYISKEQERNRPTNQQTKLALIYIGD